MLNALLNDLYASLIFNFFSKLSISSWIEAL